ncbi:MAG: DUF2071 domain-containing protein [Planctomycetaceae bacterium]
MRIPVIQGIIDRRILANFRVDPDVISKILPPPFRPKLFKEYAIAGICLIRLAHIRPRFFPLPWGLRSENAAHRVAVEWDVNGITQQGVYIPRRDTGSRLNLWLGGRVFPGVHHYATFNVHETDEALSVSLQSTDGKTHVHVAGNVTDRLPATSVFQSLDEVSRFFEAGALGYSVTRTLGRYDGLELHCDRWHIEPLDVTQIESSYFADETLFPRGSVSFDCALLMRKIAHEWHGRGELCCAT